MTNPRSSIHLSKRETEFLDLLAEGLRNKEIANRLGLSPETVHDYLKQIFTKLGAASRTEATLKYLTVTGRLNT